MIGTGSQETLLLGYLVAARLMILGAAAEAWVGVKAERQPLERIARPLSSGERTESRNRMD